MLQYTILKIGNMFIFGHVCFSSSFIKYHTYEINMKDNIYNSFLSQTVNATQNSTELDNIVLSYHNKL